MDLEVTIAPAESKQVIKNLMQFYKYDFSEFIDCNPEEDGLFAAYPDLENYWNEKNNKFPYIIKKDGQYIGFALVSYIESGERNYFSIAEFFIMRKNRRKGVGRDVARYIFNLHKGPWEVYQKESNKPAQLFWNKVIREYSNGQFSERLEQGRLIQDFES
jgi:predicted acetyltransferase